MKEHILIGFLGLSLTLNVAIFMASIKTMDQAIKNKSEIYKVESDFKFLKKQVKSIERRMDKHVYNQN